MIEEYKRSLKMPEAEELFDLLFYRPVAFFFVKIIYRLPITPNQVTILSLAAGLYSAWYFSIGISQALVWAGVWYCVANILDCSDGQLARLQKSGTPLGRLVDGVVDYIISVAIFLGIGFGLAARGESQWVLVVLGGLSSALHAIFFDRYQSEFIATVRGEENFQDREVERFSKEIHQESFIKKLVLRLYLQYMTAQQQLGERKDKYKFDPQQYRAANLLMIRLWSFLGPTTNRTLLILCAIYGRVDVFLWVIATLGNFWLLVCIVLQRRITRQLEISVSQ